MKKLTQKISFLVEPTLKRSITAEASGLSMTPGELIRTVLSMHFDTHGRKQRQKKAVDHLLSLKFAIDPDWIGIKRDIVSTKNAGI